MEQEALQTIRKYHMLQYGDTVLAGVSGGADSTALLLFLCSIQKSWNLTLLAVHVHHGIRGKEADADSACAEALCQSLGIPVKVVHVSVPEEAKRRGMGLEEAGRAVRYEIFDREAELLSEKAKIAVAHNMGDLAETVLLNLARGSGMTGLCGIPPVRGRVIRPLLYTSRAQIETYLREKGVSWRTDASNLSDGYQRNKIRLHLLPFLEEEVNVQAVRHIAATASLLREEEEYMERQAEEAFFSVRTGEEDRQVLLDIEKLRQYPEVMVRRVLRLAVRRLTKDGRDVGQVHITALSGLLEKPTGKRVSLPRGFFGEVCYGKLVLEKASFQEAETDFCYTATIGEKIFIKEANKTIFLSLNQENYTLIGGKGCTKAFDYDKIEQDFRVRHRRAGDKIYLVNRGTKKVSDYLIDRKIPKNERGKIPLFVCGGQIVWMIGYDADERFLASENTKNILRVTYWEDV